jgi:hypothetical protein
MLPESGFLATLSFMFHFKSQIQPTHVIHALRPGGAKHDLEPKDGDVMINDAGKHEVKNPPLAASGHRK